MSWKKKATVSFHEIETMDDEYFINFTNTMTMLLESGNTSEHFQDGEETYLWKVLETVDIVDTPAFFVGIVKERSAWPVWFDEAGAIDNVPLQSGSLGELTYAFILPAHKLAVSVAGGAGATMGMVRKFLNLFTADQSIKLNPVFEEGVENKVMNWDSYRKFRLSVAMPTGDDVTDLVSTDNGSFLKLVDELGGLKIDVSITMNRQKGSLYAARVREFIADMMGNELCTKVEVQGAEFEDSNTELYDLKNPQLKYQEDMEISGSFMAEYEAKPLLTRAFNENRDLLTSM